MYNNKHPILVSRPPIGGGYTNEALILWIGACLSVYLALFSEPLSNN